MSITIIALLAAVRADYELTNAWPFGQAIVTVSATMVREMAEFITARAPAGEKTAEWKYQVATATERMQSARNRGVSDESLPTTQTASSSTRSLPSTSSVVVAGSLQMRDARRAFQSKFLTWSDSIAPAIGKPLGRTTSNGYPFT